MQERIKEIPNKLKEFWNRYTSKQKTIVISVICVVLLLIGLTAWFISRPKWTQFQTFENLDDANAMVNALNDADIRYKASDNGLTLYVRDEDMTDALYTMSDNGLVDRGYTWDKAFDNSMSTTENEKSQKRILALQSQIKQSIINYSFVDDANIFIDVPDTSYKVLEDSDSNATSITAMIKVSDSNKDVVTTETAEALAYWLANAVGTDTEHVIINDFDGNAIFNGALDDGLGGSLVGGSSEYVDKLRNTIAENVRKLLLKCDFDDIEVGTQGIQFDMRKIDTLSKTYSVADGREYGYPTKLYTYSSQGATGVAGEPGTQSNNDDTDTVFNYGRDTSSTIDVEKLEGLLTNETIENIKQEKPTVQIGDSSIGIVATRFVIYDEQQLEDDGTLNGMTFEEFIAQNNNPVVTTVDQAVLDLISAATGINTDNINIVAYEVPQFVEKVETTRSISDYLMIILTVLIIALLIFVVLRGAAPLRTAEAEEPELSVEQLLATTKENQSLDDIEFSEKSETRKMIEKFVDENPEAVAQLLRNWLNEDWD